jgi:hypothetical protein
MKRFLIFTVLFPPLALVVFAVPMFDFSEPAMWVWMLGYAYLFVTIPAWLTAGVDWAVSSIRVHIVMTTVAAAIIALLTARYSFGQKGEYLYYALMGAIPAAVCSWLSSGRK